MLKSLLTLPLVVSVLAATPASAQPRTDDGPGRGGGPPSGVPSVRAPEFDVRSAGAGAILVIGGALVLMSIRRHRSQPER